MTKTERWILIGIVILSVIIVAVVAYHTIEGVKVVTEIVKYAAQKLA